MKKIKDFISVDSGLFKIMNEIETEKYENIFEDLLPETLDYDFYNMSSNRYASPVITNCETLETVVEVILNHFYSNWLKVKISLTADYDVLNPYFKETTRESKGKQENESGTTNNTENYIYAYNSEDPSDKDKSLTEIGNSGTIDSEETSIETVKGNNGNTLSSEMIQKELELRRISFINIVLNDVKELLTLSIY